MKPNTNRRPTSALSKSDSEQNIKTLSLLSHTTPLKATNNPTQRHFPTLKIITMDFVKDMKKDSQPGNSIEGKADNAVNQGTLFL